MNFISKYLLLNNCLKPSVKAEINGIKISDCFKDDNIFTDTIVSSLKLIEEHDPALYKKITNNIKWVGHRDSENAHPRSEVTFPKEKWCLIKYDNFHNDPLLVNAYYSGLLIRSAIKSLLYSKGIKIKNNNIEKAYGLCIKQENIFYVKFENANPKYKGAFTQRSFNLADLRKLSLSERMKNYLKITKTLIKELKE